MGERKVLNKYYGPDFDPSKLPRIRRGGSNNHRQMKDDSGFEGGRCGICIDVIIERGVLDCCQHWFCFACIDNWSTITNLCPLCQGEFQLITCVPVYDTTGSNNIDEDSISRDDDWCIEGKSNSMSFPSYYIDENAVICLDGDGCKIRSGSTTVEADSNLDTSIACDSCDLWYHAFCVGFDPEGTFEDSWLCPRCVVEVPQDSVENSIQRTNNQCSPKIANGECSAEAAFSRKVSVSVADAGETALVVSIIGGNQWTEEPMRNFSQRLKLTRASQMKLLILTRLIQLQVREVICKHHWRHRTWICPYYMICLHLLSPWDLVS